MRQQIGLFVIFVILSTYHLSSAKKKEECDTHRIYERKECNKITKTRRVMILHNEMKGGKCVVDKDYITEKCDLETPHCKTGKHIQQICKPHMKFRIVTHTEYLMDKKTGKCKRKITSVVEPCSVLVSGHSCPSNKVLETAVCEGGFAKELVFQYRRSEKGKCHRTTKTIAVICKKPKKEEKKKKKGA